MPEIKVTVRDKQASADNTIYVCGNSDYTIHFDFDAEWNKFEFKTARFDYGGEYADIVFAGNRCPVPILQNITHFYVGVFAGNLHTSTSAYVYAKKCCTDNNGAPADPPKPFYGQIMDAVSRTHANLGRVEPLNNVYSSEVHNVDTCGIPVFVEDAAAYPEYRLTEPGWYVFNRIHSPDGTRATSVTGAAGSILGNSYVDVAVRFETAAMSCKVDVLWGGNRQETYMFRSTDLAIRNLDYRTTFYLCDLADYTSYEYPEPPKPSSDEEGQGDEDATSGEEPSGEEEPPKPSRIVFSGFERNLTYALDETITIPIKIILPEIPKDGHGAWFEFNLHTNAAVSILIILPDGDTMFNGTVPTISTGDKVNTLQFQYFPNERMWTIQNTPWSLGGKTGQAGA